MTRVFVSYRRSDTADIVDTVDLLLAEAIGRAQVYRDIKSIQPGEDWVSALSRAIALSDVLVAVVGNDWVGAGPGSRPRRIDERDDTVRMEVSAALASRIPIIPVRVHGAEIPRIGSLPLEVAKLARLNAMLLRPDHLDEDITALVAAITAMQGRRGEALPPHLDVNAAASETLAGDWMTQDGRGTVLTYTFNRDGTYDFLGVARIDRPGSWMELESHHVGEYQIEQDTLRLTAFRSTISERGNASPEENYRDKAQASKEATFRFRLAGSNPPILTLISAAGNEVHYQCLNTSPA